MLPEQNKYLSSIAIGKINDKYIFAYDTNESYQINEIYKRKKYVTSTELGTFDDFAISDIRGDICEKGGKVFIITATGIYSVDNGNVITAVSEENILTEKTAVIDTDR